MDSSKERVVNAHRQAFGQEDILVRSPGRVNLIGEHTDYNEGFVLPAAIDKAIYFALTPAKGKDACFFAADLGQSFRFQVGRLERSPLGWPNYLLGVIDQLQRMNHEVDGFFCAFGGDIPIGAGLSSSAALEAGLAFSLNLLFEMGIAPLDLVKLSQRAENEFVGVQCGIMDQYVNIFGRGQQVLKIDCRSLTHEYFPFTHPECRVVLCDTQVHRELAGSEYNIRRRQCEEGAALLRRHYPKVRSLRDATTKMLSLHEPEFDPMVRRRCDYVVRENARVGEACSHLLEKDLAAFGEAMYRSHTGLRDDYQVSCPELDLLVELAAGCPGVFGARMMGAGFGGCTINLVHCEQLPEFTRRIEEGYRERMQREVKIHVTKIESGTGIVG